MITRIWRGWTAPGHAAAYQSLLLNKIFPGIAKRNIAGYRGISLVRRDRDNEVEFATIMWFDSIAFVQAFAGADYEIAVVPPEARAVLRRYDERSAHYETIVSPPGLNSVTRDS
jgi:hypothetical protein